MSARKIRVAKSRMTKMRSGACIATSIARFLVLGLGNQTAGYNESYESYGITDKLKQSPYLGKEPCVLATVWPLCHVIHSNITVLSSAVLDMHSNVTNDS